jgi:hypothetical protein
LLREAGEPLTSEPSPIVNGFFDGLGWFLAISA